MSEGEEMMRGGNNEGHRHHLKIAEVITENTDAILERGMIVERKVINTVTITAVGRIEGDRHHHHSLLHHRMTKEGRSIKNIIIKRDVKHHLLIEVQV